MSRSPVDSKDLMLNYHFGRKHIHAVQDRMLVYSQGRGHDRQSSPDPFPENGSFSVLQNTNGSQLLLATRPIIPEQYATLTILTPVKRLLTADTIYYIVRYAILIWRDI